MKGRVLRGAAFAALLVTGALTASAVAGGGPLRILQTESSSTSSSTSTGSTSSSTSSSTSTTTTTTTTTTTPKKITICHHARTKSGNVKHVTIRISRNAWNAHRKHGDTLGSCSTAANKKAHSRSAHVKRFHKKRPK